MPGLGHPSWARGASTSRFTEVSASIGTNTSAPLRAAELAAPPGFN
jgi:hypothetical protein